MSECWLGQSPYNCEDCDGNQNVWHDVHGELDCERCGGTGWEPDLVDIEAYLAAVKALNQKMIDAGCMALTHEWIEGENRLGRDGDKYGKVAVADYLIGVDHGPQKVPASIGRINAQHAQVLNDVHNHGR